MSAWQTASGRAMAVSLPWRFVVIADCEVAVGGWRRRTDRTGDGSRKRARRTL